MKNRSYFSKFLNLNNIFGSSIPWGYSKEDLPDGLSIFWSICKLIYLITMCYWEGHFPSDSFYKYWKQAMKIRRFTRRFLSLNSFAWIEVPFAFIKHVTFFCFALLKFRLEFCNADDCNMLHDYWVFVDSLKSVAAKKLLFYMNASTINSLIWVNQFNTIINSLVIVSLFQIFSFYNLTCNKCYVDGERNFGRFLGHNKRHKYGLI